MPITEMTIKGDFKELMGTIRNQFSELKALGFNVDDQVPNITQGTFNDCLTSIGYNLEALIQELKGN